MSKFRTHAYAGAVIAILYSVTQLVLMGNAFFEDIVHIVLTVAVIPLPAMLPDVDQAASQARKVFLSIAFLGIIGLALFQYYLLIIAIAAGFLIVIMAAKHRGFMHSQVFGLVVAMPWLLYNWMFAVAMFASFLTHILLDRTTKNNDFPY